MNACLRSPSTSASTGPWVHRLGPVVASTLLALLFLGCATQVGQYNFIGKAYPPKPADFPIEVFTNGVPSRPFERAAILDAHCESQYWSTPSLETVAIPELKRQARAAGCDAIIELEVRKPTEWSLETRTIHVTAIGVVYR